MMKKLLGIMIMVVAFNVTAQTNSDLLNHYKAYYKQMQAQGDIQGIINALTHLNVLEPNQARLDTLAALYMNGGSHNQALNTIGFEKKASDSDMAVEVKAICLKAVNQPQLAVEHFEELFKRKPTAMLAYELAELKLQLKDFTGAMVSVTYGLANAKDDEMRAYYESQTPYQVPLKAGFTYLKGILKFSENEQDLDSAIATLNEAIQMAPNFNLATLSRQALEARKTQPQKN
jgi:tetratricopeptide (TPR) repeat protein